MEAESTAVDPTIEKPLLKTPTGTSSTAPTLVPRSQAAKAPANGLAVADKQAKVFMFLFLAKCNFI